MTQQKINREKIKVLHIITVFSIGGATENTLLSVEYLQELGYDVSILTGENIESEGSLFDRAKNNNIRVTILKQLQKSIHPFYDLVALLKIFIFLRKNKFQIVHTHSSKAGFLGRLAAYFAGVPIIIHTIHGLPFHEYQGKSLKNIFIFVEKLSAEISDKIITVSDTIIQKCLKENIALENKFVTVRSGFEVGNYLKLQKSNEEIRKRFGISKDDLVIGKIARFSPLKGHEYLIEVIPEIVKLFPNAKFVFVGSGELENIFRLEVEKRNILSNVIFTGLIPQNQIPDMIAMMDIVVHTSLLEGLARVLPQSLLMKKGVISFDIDGAHEVIKNNKTGFLVSPMNKNQLRDAIIKMLNSKKLRNELGANGSKFVRDKWSVEAMGSGIDKLYKNLILEKQIKLK